MTKRTTGYANLAGEVFETELPEDKALELSVAEQFVSALRSRGLTYSVVGDGKQEPADVILEGADGLVDLQVGEAFDDILLRREQIRDGILSALWDPPTLAQFSGMSFNFGDTTGADGPIDLKRNLKEITTCLRAGMKQAYDAIADSLREIEVPGRPIPVDIPCLPRPIFINFGRYAYMAEQKAPRYIWTMDGYIGAKAPNFHFKKVMESKIKNKYGLQKGELWLLIWSLKHSFNLEEESAARELIQATGSLPFKRIYVMFGGSVVQIFPFQDNSAALQKSPSISVVSGLDFMPGEHDSRWIYPTA